MNSVYIFRTCLLPCYIVDDNLNLFFDVLSSCSFVRVHERGVVPRYVLRETFVVCTWPGVTGNRGEGTRCSLLRMMYLCLSLVVPNFSLVISRWNAPVRSFPMICCGGGSLRRGWYGHNETNNCFFVRRWVADQDRGQQEYGKFGLCHGTSSNLPLVVDVTVSTVGSL